MVSFMRSKRLQAAAADVGRSGFAAGFGERGAAAHEDNRASRETRIGLRSSPALQGSMGAAASP